MDKLDEAKMYQLIHHLRQVENMSELKQLAKLHNMKKQDFLKVVEKNSFTATKVIVQDPHQHRITAIEDTVRTEQPKVVYEFTEPLTHFNFWSSGLCSFCLDTKTCLSALLCPTCFFCWLHHKAEEHCCTLIICPCAFGSLRTKIRTNYKISGQIWLDHLSMVFCGFCTMVQMANELRYQGVIK